jgi:hypothetical protein
VHLSEKAIGRASEVFHRARLGDKRLERRAVALAEALAANPKLSLPKVWSTPAVLEAGYHFLRNPRCAFTELMKATQQATHESVVKEHCALVLHDTTDIVCQAAEPEEVGFLATGKPGFFVHHALCVREDASRTPLGMVWADAWGRPQRSTGRKRTASGSELAKLDDRESDRWLEGLTEAQLWTDGCEQVIHVMDSEADSYRLFEHAHELNADFVVRLRHNRRLDEGALADELCASAIKLSRKVPLSSRKKKTTPRTAYRARAAREVELSVRCATVEIQPPRHMASAEPVTVNVVQVMEEHPAMGNEPVAWVLATSLPTQTRAQIERVIDIYRARWLIEEFHKALKTGCMFEKRSLESFESITTLLALCYPIACELLRVRSRARQNLPAGQVLRQSMLDCLRAHPNARPLPDEPTAEEALGVIAGLGGHIKYSGPPGWQTLAAGYMEMLAFERGWLAALAAHKM